MFKKAVVKFTIKKNFSRWKLKDKGLQPAVKFLKYKKHLYEFAA